MRLALLLVLIGILSCKTLDLSTRPVWALLPTCLIVNAQTDWQRQMVADAVKEQNERLDFEAFRIAPSCESGDELVPLSFLVELPENCPSHYGCTISHHIVNGVPTIREVVIHSDAAPYSTVLHELGHLAGCKHGDLDPPCMM